MSKLKIKGIVLKLTNEFVLYPIFFKKKEGEKITKYFFLFFKLTIIRNT